MQRVDRKNDSALIFYPNIITYLFCLIKENFPKKRKIQDTETYEVHIGKRKN